MGWEQKVGEKVGEKAEEKMGGRSARAGGGVL